VRYNPTVAYQAENARAFDTRDSGPSLTSARYWGAPCLACAAWRSAWPYASNVSFRGLSPRPLPPGTNPLLFIWGNMTRGLPRRADSKFFDAAWLAFVAATPHGKVQPPTPSPPLEDVCGYPTTSGAGPLHYPVPS
jgi:hypothetical protein